MLRNQSRYVASGYISFQYVITWNKNTYLAIRLFNQNVEILAIIYHYRSIYRVTDFICRVTLTVLQQLLPKLFLQFSTLTDLNFIGWFPFFLVQTRLLLNVIIGKNSTCKGFHLSLLNKNRAKTHLVSVLVNSKKLSLLL